LPVFGGYEAYLDMEPHIVERFMLAWKAKKDAEAELERRANTKTKEVPDEPG
jgi:hypothetical protein